MTTTTAPIREKAIDHFEDNKGDSLPDFSPEMLIGDNKEYRKNIDFLKDFNALENMFPTPKIG